MVFSGVSLKAHSHQAHLRPSTRLCPSCVDGRRRAWCEWAL